MATDGLVSIQSSHGPAESKRRLLAELEARGLTLFAHVDHAAGAAAIGQSLRPTDLFIFGNSKGGTPLMAADQAVGIDLPLKALIWEDSAGATWLAYNDPAWLARRHQLPAEAARATSALATALESIARKVIG